MSTQRRAAALVLGSLIGLSVGVYVEQILIDLRREQEFVYKEREVERRLREAKAQRINEDAS